MTDTQRAALKKMDDRTAGALRINGRWIFREDIRNSEAVAKEIMEWNA